VVLILPPCIAVNNVFLPLVVVFVRLKGMTVAASLDVYDIVHFFKVRSMKSSRGSLRDLTYT
jgi:hypothetical protein